MGMFGKALQIAANLIKWSVGTGGRAVSGTLLLCLRSDDVSEA